MHTQKPFRVLFAALVALMLVATACGDNTATADPSDDEAPSDDADAATDPADDDAADDLADVENDPLPPADDDEPVDDDEADPPAPTLEGDLVGLFGLDPADCAVVGSETGSFFRMVGIGGTLEDGPFIENADSTCADQTFIPLAPGTDGGLLTGELQPGPEPLFDDANNATADRIAAPTTFFGVAFAMATTDEAESPTITATGGVLSGDVAAVSAYYAGLIFNQGSPKPDGSAPGITTAAPTGTIDDDTGAYVLDWASQIVGGSFNEFTGVWHLEGTFAPAG